MKKALMIVSLCAVLAGCVTVSNNKRLTIAPSKDPVVVTAVSQAKCYDLFLVMYCRLNMAIEASNGKKVSDFTE